MRLFVRTFFALLLLFSLNDSRVQAQDVGWTIEQFSTRIDVDGSGKVSVRETITVDFNGLQKHGIFRTIPVNYKDRFGNKLNIRLSVLSVTDGDGDSLQYQVKRRGSDVEVKIGDPQKTVSNVQTYVIGYVVNRVIIPFDEHDELYWNATGNEWPVQIRQAEATVSLPSELKDAACFSGPFGSSLRNCAIEDRGNKLQTWTQDPLFPGEGLTLVVAIPKGVIDHPSAITRFFWFLTDNWPYALPLGTLVVLLGMYWRHGRDDRYKSTFDPSKGSERLPLFASELVPSTYAPLKDLTPAEAGTLIDEEVDIRDIAATMIDLAIRGFVKIKEIEKGKILKKKDFELLRTGKDKEGELEEYERLLLNGLFEDEEKTTLSDQKYRFHKHLAKIRDALYKEMMEKRYFNHRPDTIVKLYRGIGVVVLGLGLTLGFFLGQATGQFLAWIIGMSTSGLIILLFAKAMPKRTPIGRRNFLRVLGLRSFVSLGAYREQIWERANIFEEVLPFAIAFNLTHQWAEAFEKAKVPPPSWYNSTQSFNPLTFSHSMEQFTQETTKSLPAVRSTSASSGGSGFGGGGFSGGGFGGGGGGSW